MTPSYSIIGLCILHMIEVNLMYMQSFYLRKNSHLKMYYVTKFP